VRSAAARVAHDTRIKRGWADLQDNLIDLFPGGTMTRLLIVAAALTIVAAPAAQHYQTDFPPEEFRARWTRVFDRIGDQAVAVAQGVPLTNGYQLPRQHNTFY
jgi:hypothetical protein